MASKYIFTWIILLLLPSLILLMGEPSDCRSAAYGCFGANADGFKQSGNGEVLLAAWRGKQTALKPGHGGSSSSKYGENSSTSELRTVPSGPNPLHHYGGSPHKHGTP